MDLDKSTIEQLSKPLKSLPQLLQAAFQNDSRRLESLSINIIRALRSSFPEISKEMSSVLVNRKAGIDPARLAQIDPPPLDRDSTAPLVKVEVLDFAKEPVLSKEITEQLSRFIRERNEHEKLFAEGVMPPRTVLLMGPPGTGKTILARWLATQLQLPLVTLDLAASISSYLGKTGMNLRRVLDYSRARPCLLLLDEFDSIAKKRDDSTDVGELKRIVNVLLKELEDWPSQSVLVAATNHPELLDPAISRRFDRTIAIGLPSQDERLKIMSQVLGRFAEAMTPNLMAAVSGVLEGKSGSDVEMIAGASIRRNIVDSEPIEKALIAELKTALGDQRSESTTNLVKAFDEQSKGSSTVREIASALDLSPSTVQYHLKKKANKNG
jgi:SpoVK/Ycf46/Vps4 family AAA+-type ATPase